MKKEGVIIVTIIIISLLINISFVSSGDLSEVDNLLKDDILTINQHENHSQLSSSSSQKSSDSSGLGEGVGSNILFSSSCIMYIKYKILRF